MELEQQGRPPRGLYRAPDGWIFGVCRGLADRFDLSAFWIRMGVLLLAYFWSFWWVLGGYVVLGLLLKKGSYTRQPHRAAIIMRTCHRAEPRSDLEEELNLMRARTLRRCREWNDRLSGRYQ